MLSFECSILPGSIFSLSEKTVEVTHLVGVSQKCDCGSLAISFCFRVRIHPTMCQKMCVKSHTDLDTSRGSYFYHGGGRNQKVTSGGEAKAGLSEAGSLWSAGPGQLVLQPCQNGLGLRRGRGGSSEEFLCKRPA